MRTFVIPFYYGFGSENVTGTVTVINYGSASAKAKSYGPYGSGSRFATLLQTGADI
jgi:hypothetical protein